MIFIAKFTNSLKVDTPIVLTLGVSLDHANQHQTGEELAATLGMIIRSHINGKISGLQIVLSDDLRRHYEGLGAAETPEETRKASADKFYNDWLDEDGNWKYLSIFKDITGALATRKAGAELTPEELAKIAAAFSVLPRQLERAREIPLTIIRWRTLTDSDSYRETKAKVDAAYASNTEFHEIVRGIATSHASKCGLDAAIEFLKEEAAVFAGPLKDCHSAYPSREFNGAITWAVKNIAEVTPHYHGYGIYAKDEKKPQLHMHRKEMRREERSGDGQYAAVQFFLKAAWDACPRDREVVPKIDIEQYGSKFSVTYTPAFWSHRLRPRSGSDPLPLERGEVALQIPSASHSANGDCSPKPL